MTMKLKICEICQGTKFLTEDKIKEAVCKRGIKKFAYILHDKDTYTEDDEKKNSEHKAGTLKEPHWHICLQFKDSQDTKIILKNSNIVLMKSMQILIMLNLSKIMEY